MDCRHPTSNDNCCSTPNRITRSFLAPIAMSNSEVLREAMTDLANTPVSWTYSMNANSITMRALFQPKAPAQKSPAKARWLARKCGHN